MVLRLTEDPWEGSQTLEATFRASGRDYRIFDVPWNHLDMMRATLDQVNLVLVPGGNGAKFEARHHQFMRLLPGIANNFFNPNNVWLGNNLGGIFAGTAFRSGDQLNGSVSVKRRWVPGLGLITMSFCAHGDAEITSEVQTYNEVAAAMEHESPGRQCVVIDSGAALALRRDTIEVVSSTDSGCVRLITSHGPKEPPEVLKLPPGTVHDAQTILSRPPRR